LTKNCSREKREKERNKREKTALALFPGATACRGLEANQDSAVFAFLGCVSRFSREQFFRATNSE
jgi:hypothetical protein